jgi:hypothetical protein
MYPAELMDAVLSAGLFQLGAFHHTTQHKPYRLRLDLLPSYPAVLMQSAKAVAALIEGRPSRLVCTSDAIALATVVSQALDIPLVIHSGKLGQPAHNLVGAYDVGHAAVLISLDTDQERAYIMRLVDEAANVGLHISQWVSLTGLGPINELRHVAAIELRDMAEYLVERGEVSAQMASRILGDG